MAIKVLGISLILKDEDSGYTLVYEMDESGMFYASKRPSGADEMQQEAVSEKEGKFLVLAARIAIKAVRDWLAAPPAPRKALVEVVPKPETDVTGPGPT